MFRRRLLRFIVSAVVVGGLTTNTLVSSASAVPPLRFTSAPGAPFVSLIGDSTLAGVRWNQTFGTMPASYNFLLDAESCRRTIEPSCRGREGYVPDNVLAALARLHGQLGAVLVLMGGYDDPGTTFNQAVDAVISAAKTEGIGHVMWLTMRTADVSYVGPTYSSNSTTYTDNNRILLAKQQQYSGYLVLADWATYSAPHDEWEYADGIHLRPSGSTAVMDFIRTSLDALFLATRYQLPRLTASRDPLVRLS